MAISLLGSAVNNDTAGTSHFVTAYTSHGGGNALVALVGSRTGSSGSILSVTDDGSNTWTQGTTSFVSGTNGRFDLWYALNAAAITGATVNPSATTFAQSIIITEWSGVLSAGAVDQTGAFKNSAATAFVSGTIVTTNASDVIIAGGAHTTTNSATESAGFTSLTTAGASSNCVTLGAYKIVSSTGNYQGSWNMSGTTTGGAGIISLQAALSLVQVPWFVNQYVNSVYRT